MVKRGGALTIQSQAFQIGNIISTGGNGGKADVDVKQIAKVDDTSAENEGGRSGGYKQAVGLARDGRDRRQQSNSANLAGAVALAGNGLGVGVGVGGDGGSAGSNQMNTVARATGSIDNSSTAIANNATKGGVAGGIGIKDALLVPGSLNVLDPIAGSRQADRISEMSVERLDWSTTTVVVAES